MIEIDLLILLWEVELAVDIDENKMGSKLKVPKEVKAAKKKEVRQTPHRNPTAQIWQENELLICNALWETTLSIDFWFIVSISVSLSFSTILISN